MTIAPVFNPDGAPLLIDDGLGGLVPAMSEDPCDCNCPPPEESPEEDPNDGSDRVEGCRSLFFDHYTPHAAIIEVEGVTFTPGLQCAECVELNGIFPLRLKIVSNGNNSSGTDLYYWESVTNCDKWFDTSRIGSVPFHCEAECADVTSPCYDYDCGDPDRLGSPMCKEGEMFIQWSHSDRTNPTDPGNLSLAVNILLRWGGGPTDYVGVTNSAVTPIDLTGLCTWDPVTGRWYLSGSTFEWVTPYHLTGTPFLTCGITGGSEMTITL